MSHGSRRRTNRTENLEPLTTDAQRNWGSLAGMLVETGVFGHTVAVAHMAGRSRAMGRCVPKALAGDEVATAIELKWLRADVPAQFRGYVHAQ